MSLPAPFAVLRGTSWARGRFLPPKHVLQSVTCPPTLLSAQRSSCLRSSEHTFTKFFVLSTPRPPERLGRGLLRGKAAPLHAPRTAPAVAIPVHLRRPAVSAPSFQLEHLTLLCHREHSSIDFDRGNNCALRTHPPPNDGVANCVARRSSVSSCAYQNPHDLTASASPNGAVRGCAAGAGHLPRRRRRCASDRRARRT